MHNIADLRKEYKKKSLLEDDLSRFPVDQFSTWWTEAESAGIEEMNAMTLATATPEGIPSARIVLLKGFSERGFVFYTNYHSHKGKELADNPNTSLVFFWKELERQVRIQGVARKVSAEESDLYFNSRPEGSRIGAWASPQSTVISTREEIEDNAIRYREEFTGVQIPRPPHWGGYIVEPRSIEFWQGRPSRLHDRLLYSLDNKGDWRIERLAP